MTENISEEKFKEFISRLKEEIKEFMELKQRVEIDGYYIIKIIDNLTKEYFNSPQSLKQDNKLQELGEGSGLSPSSEDISKSNHSQESPRGEKLLEAKATETNETPNGVGIGTPNNSDIGIHPDALRGFSNHEVN